MPRNQSTRMTWVDFILSAIVMLAGVGMALPGAYLLSLGGSAYYLLAGLGLFVAGVLYWRGRPSGVRLFVFILIATVIWSLWESGLDGWALLPRLGLLLGLGIAILLARSAAVSSRRFMRSAVAVVVVLGVAAVAGALAWRTPGHETHVASALDAPGDAKDWHYIGGDQGAQRFSGLNQITPENVSGLEVAWKVHLGMPPATMGAVMEATPLKIGDTLYTCNMHNVVIALDPETGEIRWQADPKMDTSGVSMAACKGVSYWRDAEAEPDAPCAERIIQTTYDARLIALDVRSGQRCPGFGDNGAVDLRQGMGNVPLGYYYLTSPAAVVNDKLVVGGSFSTTRRRKNPPA